MFSKISLFSLTLGIFLVGAPVQAGNSLTTIQGENLHFHSVDHGFSGHIGNALVFGAFDHDSFSSKLTVYQNDTLSVGSFKKFEDRLKGGILPHSLDDWSSEMPLVSVEVLELDKETNEFVIKINDHIQTVKIRAEDYKNRHFINPVYSTTMESGEEFSFRLNGQACYGYSAHLITMIVGASAYSNLD